MCVPFNYLWFPNVQDSDYFLIFYFLFAVVNMWHALDDNGKDKEFLSLVAHDGNLCRERVNEFAQIAF